MSSLVRRGVRWVLRRYGVVAYEALKEYSDEAAKLAFAHRVNNLGHGYNVQHPIYLKGSEYLQIGTGFFAGPGLRIEAWDHFQGENFKPQIILGNSVGMNWNVHIGAIGRIEIQDDVLIGSNVLITDHSHGGLMLDDQDTPPAHRLLVSKGPVVIEQNVWIGEGACILGGVRVGRSAVIGANAVVTKDVSPGEIVGGVPARPISQMSGRKSNSITDGKDK